MKQVKCFRNFCNRSFWPNFFKWFSLLFKGTTEEVECSVQKKTLFAEEVSISSESESTIKIESNSTVSNLTSTVSFERIFMGRQLLLMIFNGTTIVILQKEWSYFEKRKKLFRRYERMFPTKETSYSKERNYSEERRNYSKKRRNLNPKVHSSIKIFCLKNTNSFFNCICTEFLLIFLQFLYFFFKKLPWFLLSNFMSVGAGVFSNDSQSKHRQ